MGRFFKIFPNLSQNWLKFKETFDKSGDFAQNLDRLVYEWVTFSWKIDICMGLLSNSARSYQNQTPRIQTFLTCRHKSNMKFTMKNYYIQHIVWPALTPFIPSYLGILIILRYIVWPVLSSFIPSYLGILIILRRIVWPALTAFIPSYLGMQIILRCTSVRFLYSILFGNVDNSQAHCLTSVNCLYSILFGNTDDSQVHCFDQC